MFRKIFNKNMLRVFSVLLTFSLLFISFASCTDNSKNTSDSITTTTQTKEITNPENQIGEIYIIRPFSASNTIKDLGVALKKILTDYADKVVYMSDDTGYEAVNNRIYILIGKTNYTLSQNAADAADENSIKYLSSSDSIAIYADSDSLIWIASERFISESISDGSFKLKDEYKDLALDADGIISDDWCFDFPSYAGGKLDSTLYSAGYGLSQNLNRSDMHVVNDTNPEHFTAYLNTLEEWGYIQTFSNEIDGNLFASYQSVLGKNVYMYLFLGQSKVRIIQDMVSVPLDEFCYETEASDDTAFYMFRLNSDSEDLMLIHLADNSWIIIDGGVSEHNTTDPTGKLADDLFNFMKEKSGLSDDEKLVISCWYLSHPHRDHFLGFKSLISRYHSKIDLQRILANTPDTEVVANSNYNDYLSCINLVTKYYPNVKYLKVHTGMIITLADVKFTILSTQEDMVEIWTPVFGQSVSSNIYDINNSSICSMLEIGGVKTLQLGDAFRADYLLLKNYNISTLTSDILKTAHHFYNVETVTFSLMLDEGTTLKYALVNHASNPTDARRAPLTESFINKIINARYDTIFCFKFINGEIILSEIKV